MIIANTPVKQVINPIILIKLIFSPKNIARNKNNKYW